MAREHLARRANWQGKGVARGQGAEDVFSVIMSMHLKNTGLEAEHKPKDLSGIYGVRSTGKPHGIIPEYAIRNPETGKAVYIEIKRQRPQGNAHERACKYFAPGIISSARKIARQPAEVTPFWWIFTNGIASDSNYRREIMHWFQGMEEHVLLWRDVRDFAAVTEHFDRHIRRLLD